MESIKITALANFPIVFLNYQGANEFLSSYQSYLISFA